MIAAIILSNEEFLYHRFTASNFILMLEGEFDEGVAAVNL